MCQKALFLLLSLSYQNSSTFSSILCCCFALYVYFFSTVNIKRWLLFSVSSVSTDQTLASGLVQSNKNKKKKHTPTTGRAFSFSLKGKLDWDNPVCHTNYSKQTWNLDCILNVSGRRPNALWLEAKRGWGGQRATYPLSTLNDWSAGSQHTCKKSKARWHVFNNKTPNSLCINLKGFLGPLFEEYQESSSLSLSLKWCGSDCPLMVGRERRRSGVAKQPTVPCSDLTARLTPSPSHSCPLLLSRTTTDRPASLHQITHKRIIHLRNLPRGFDFVCLILEHCFERKYCNLKWYVG